MGEEDDVRVGDTWGETMTVGPTLRKLVCVIMSICCLKSLNSMLDYASLLSVIVIFPSINIVTKF
jgi:hypothetical protein